MADGKTGMDPSEGAERATVAPRTLSETAYGILKEKLISAQYVPGQFLQEAQVVDDLGMGRTPVHQALHRLQQEGLIEIIPRKGILVQSDSLSEIHLALETRLLIEPFCAGLTAERRTPEQLAELESICRAFDDGQADLTKKALMEMDRTFHARIAQFSGNHLLADFQRGVHDRMSRIWFLPTWHFHDFNMTSHEHGSIIDAIRARDAAAASAAMRSHVESLRLRIISANPA
ncbi:MAG: GntR family transcriptional regulator [Pseudorhodobacter sp. PARRP1]|nr:MAG: GntR family transcriptional regulator [Pseudorhodobacter sp. PARRP1]